VPRKTYLSGAFPIEIETPEGIGAKVVEALRFGRDREFLETYRQKIDAVTAEQVQDFARRRIHPDGLRLVLVGNAAAFAEEVEKRWGKPTRVPFAELDLLRPDLRAAADTKPAG
jgi:zinc protease